MPETKYYEGVRAASKSSIEIDFRYRGVRCKERIKRKPTAANLKAAANHRGAVLNAIALGTFDYAATFPNSKNLHKFSPIDELLSLREYLNEWFENNRAAYKSSTYLDNGRILNNFLIPTLGEIPLADLRSIHVREWAKTLKCSLKRVRNILAPLKAALKHAVEDEYIELSPLEGWTYKRQEPPKRDHIEPFTKKEQAAIIAAAQGQAKNFIQFAFWSGLRTSELVALIWDDIRFNEGVIIINKAKTEAANEPETPKTEASVRRVKLLPPAIEAMRAQEVITTGLVFCNEDGGYLTPNDINNKWWKPALEKAGVKYRNPYQTRHTYASMMLTAGEPLAWVSKQMGHKHVLTTIKRYARWIPDSDPNLGNQAVEMFT